MHAKNWHSCNGSFYFSGSGVPEDSLGSFSLKAIGYIGLALLAPYHGSFDDLASENHLGKYLLMASVRVVTCNFS